MKRTLIKLGVAALLAAPSMASAQVSCTDATTMTSFAGYLDCRGPFTGNINGSASEITQLQSFGGLWNSAWVWQGKSDDTNNGPFAGGPSSNTANATIDFDSPLSGMFVIGIKQANVYSFYLFNETSPISQIAISSIGTAPNSPGFSHIGLYTAASTPPTTSAPEPATYALLATGLGAIAVMRRRRRA